MFDTMLIRDIRNTLNHFHRSMDGLFRGIVAGSILAGFLSTPVLAQATPPCWLQDASASGPAVWLLCQEGKALRSDDQGARWREQTLPSNVRLHAITFLDSRRGFVVGENGTVLVTEDGGSSWRQVPAPTQERLTAIHFVGESGWVAGRGGVILHSPDGGRTWRPQPTGVSQPLEDIYFADAQHGWAVGWVGTILRTINGGRSWEQVRTAAAPWSLSAVYFRDSQNGWAVGFAGQILRSRDGGVTWEAQASPVKSWLTAVLFDRSNRGWVAGDDALLVSENGGESWKPVRVEDVLFLSRLLPVNGSLWAIGPFNVLKQSGGDLAWKKIENFSTDASSRAPRPSAGNKAS